MLLAALTLVSRWAIPVFLLVVLVAAMRRRVPVYETFVEGAKEGFDTAIRILPFLLGMFVAIGVLRESGALASFLAAVAPLVEPFGIPREVLPLAILRPLSGSGSLGVMSELLSEHGPDSLIGLMAATIQGSSETTFYVLTVYFGSVGVRQARHSVAVGLLADVAAFVAAVFVVSAVFGGAATG